VTWSIVARDADGAFGVAVASRFFAVGALCPSARSGIGALSTQALVNPGYGPRGLDLLEQGVTAADSLARLVAGDEGREHRQLHLIDRAGQSAGHTGALCVDWCGHRAHDGFSVAGNMLSGPRVLDDTARAYQAHAAAPFAERLLAAMAAGDAAGGDKRGKQAAALLICTTEIYAFLDLRVDDHPDPIAELKRLYKVSLERYQPFLACLPSVARPAGITDRAAIEAEVERFQAARRQR
jgi:uncharacterized Ntn-hydrolase superfamily protein